MGAAVAFATAAVGPARAQPQPFALADLARVVTISAPQLSPDGRHAVALISRIESEGNRTLDELDLIDVATSARRALTFERSGITAPKWSPDGQRIAFIANSGEGERERPQVFILPLDGGDPQRVTSVTDGVDQFDWRPDGRALAYVSVEPAPKKTGSARFVDAYEVGNGSNLLPGAARPFRVWLVPLDGSPARQLTRGPGSVTNGEGMSPLSFSPDGRSLAYLWASTPILNDADFAAAHVVDTSTGKERPLTARATHERDPQFSPDGTQIAYLFSDGDNQTHPIEAFVTAREGGSGRSVSHRVDTYVRDAAWEPGGKALYFSATVGTHTALWRSVGDAPPRPIDLHGLCFSSPLAGAIDRNGTLLVVGSTTGMPPELYLIGPDAAPRKISNYNAIVASRAMPSSERITYATSTGVAGDAVLMRPPGFARGHAYPLVVLIHGGPTMATTESFSTDEFDDLAHLMASRGWLVLQPNYRGSNNLGRRYLGAIFNDVSTGPGRDIMAAVDAVRARGIVDPHRIAVSGWSYGGVMTTWMIARYHIWRAAVAGAAVTDWIADYATADDLNADVSLFHGSPFVAANRARWLHEESITYVADVTTPVLLLADRGDARVANVSSYELFHALRDLGKPVRFIVYPVDGHFPHDPARTADVYARWMSYIGEHFTL